MTVFLFFLFLSSTHYFTLWSSYVKESLFLKQTLSFSNKQIFLTYITNDACLFSVLDWMTLLNLFYKKNEFETFLHIYYIISLLN